MKMATNLATILYTGADADPSSVGHQFDLGIGVTFARVRVVSADHEVQRLYTVLVASGELFRRYDSNENMTIEGDEVLQAVGDYFDGKITRDEVIGMVQLYFFSV